MRSFVTGAGALALCVIAGGAVVLSAPEPAGPQLAPQIDEGQAAASILCGGGFERTLEEGIDVEEIDEDVSLTSWAFADPAGAELTSGDDTTPLDGSPSYWNESSELTGTLSAEDGSATEPTEDGAEETSEDATEDGADGVHMAASTVHIAMAGDTRGMAASPCVRSSADTWLVGSTSDVGTSNQLVITNPGQTSVTVNLEAFGSVGRLDLGSNATVAVPPASTERVDLDGVIPGDSRIALHATTASGAVGVSLQQNTLDGATPGGVSFITGSATAESLVIPGVGLSAGGGTPSPVLRIVNPGSDAATVGVSLTGEEGSTELPGGSDVTVAPGSVLDLSLDGVDPGDYAVNVSAYTAVAAGVQLTAIDEESGARDIAWAAASESYTNATVMYGNVPATLGIVGASDTPVSVDVTPIMEDGTPGEPETVQAESGAYAAFSMPDDSVGVVIESEEPVRAAIRAQPALADGAGIDWVPLTSFESSQSTQRIALSN
ncbi:MAG: DUF5719 family protein [Ancrocorticia sp.]|uniref:DUF5719 family protein n=1 Tax=Ancrocorticia sp. TaxID=2593684 RepID=UPI003F8F7FFE